MTENEAKEYMKNEVECIKRASHCDRDCLNCELVREEEPLIESYNMAIQALSEIQQYREIGTIEEFKALKEKNVAKKPCHPPASLIWYCPNPHCPEDKQYLMSDKYKVCPDCGQKLDWE